MTKYQYLRASQIASGIGVAFALTWAATGASWAMWGGAGGVAAGFALWLGSYIEGDE